MSDDDITFLQGHAKAWVTLSKSQLSEHATGTTTRVLGPSCRWKLAVTAKDN
jgi:hypothetical protein